MAQREGEEEAGQHLTSLSLLFPQLSVVVLLGSRLFIPLRSTPGLAAGHLSVFLKMENILHRGDISNPTQEAEGKEIKGQIFPAGDYAALR